MFKAELATESDLGFGYEFTYTQGARKAKEVSGFIEIPGFPRLDEQYVAEELFPAFLIRTNELEPAGQGWLPVARAFPKSICSNPVIVESKHSSSCIGLAHHFSSGLSLALNANFGKALTCGNWVLTRQVGTRICVRSREQDSHSHRSSSTPIHDHQPAHTAATN